MLWFPETWEGGRLDQLEPISSNKECGLESCPRTDEAIIGTPAGVVRAGTVKRQAIEDARKDELTIYVDDSLHKWATEQAT